MIKVVFVTPWGSARCGIRSYSQFLANELARTVELWVVPHYRYALPDKRYAFWLADRVNNLNPDVIHVQHDWGFWNPYDPSVFLDFLRLLKGKKVVTLHATGFPVDRAVSDLADAIIVHNRYMFSVFQGDKEKCFIIPHGCKAIDIPKDKARRRLGVLPNTYLIGVFGFIDPRKGHDIALEAYSRLRDLEMVFVGGWHSDSGNPYMSDIIARARRLGVRVTGYVSDKEFELWLSAVDVVLQPSRAASESGVISYALGSGKAVIASDHPAFIGKPIIKFRSVDELVKAIEALRDPGARADLEAKARWYGKMFSWERVAQLHYHLYRWLLDENMYSLVQLNGVKDAIWQLAELELHGSIEAERDRIHKPRVEWIKSRLKNVSVDVGSSFGCLGAHVNIEISRYRARLGKALYRDREFIIADAHKLPFRDKAFRQALLCEVLEHLGDPKTALEEASRIADEVLITVPDEQQPYKSSGSKEHIRAFTRETLTKLIEGAGLKLLEISHVVNEESNYAWHVAIASKY